MTVLLVLALIGAGIWLTSQRGEKPKVPWGPLIRRMWPVTVTYFCYAWGLWLYLNWIPLFF